MTTVVHCKRDKYDILIDRTTSWGNPFPLENEADRGNCLKKYENWLVSPESIDIVLYGRSFNNDWVRDNIKDLTGKILGCWCKPKDCHGDILAKYADNIGLLLETVYYNEIAQDEYRKDCQREYVQITREMAMGGGDKNLEGSWWRW